MSIDWVAVATIAAPILALFVGAALDRALESRPKLTTYLSHVGAHKVILDDGSKVDVYTHAIVLRNTGRRPAKNVRLAHPVLPNFTVHPDIPYSVEDLPGGSKEILIPTIVPGDQVNISYLYYPPITWSQVNGSVRSDVGHAKVLEVLPQQQYPRWVGRLAAGLMLAGLVALLYVCFELLLWVRGLLAA